MKQNSKFKKKIFLITSILLFSLFFLIIFTFYIDFLNNLKKLTFKRKIYFFIFYYFKKNFILFLFQRTQSNSADLFDFVINSAAHIHCLPLHAYYPCVMSSFKLTKSFLIRIIVNFYCSCFIVFLYL